MPAHHPRPLPDFWNRLSHHHAHSLLVGMMVCFIGTPSISQYTVSTSGEWDPQYNNEIEVPLGVNELSGALPIGFNFSYFGNVYTQFYVSSNGFLTFDAGAGAGATGQNIPNVAQPNNSISLAWGTLNPEYVSVYYETMGTAPTRTLHVSWEVENYGDGGSCEFGYELYGQIILYEFGHVIEIHSDWWNGDACNVLTTQGIENATGTTAYITPGRNNQLWNADETYTSFTPLEIIDARVVSSPASLCTGTQDIDIVFQNLSTIPIDSIYLDWEWDGVPQPAVFINTPLDPLDILYVTLGQQTIVAGESYNLEAWSYNPDNEPDDILANDTLTTTVHAGLSGVLTIGGATPDYATISAAITALEASGVCDSVIFNIRTGTYTEELNFNYFPSTPNAYAVFKSETGNAQDVIISQTYNVAGANRLVEMNNVFNVDFRNLRFRALGTQCSNLFYLNSYCTGISITDCELYGTTCNSNTTSGALVSMVNGTKNGITLSDNLFRRGSYGIYVAPGPVSFAQDIAIVNNQIDSSYRYGVYINRGQGIVVHDNAIFLPQSGAYGIELNTLIGEGVISHNFINVPAGLFGCRINGFTDNNGNDTCLLVNNMITLAGSTANSRAMSIETSSGARVFHNSILSTSSAATGLALLVSSNTLTQVKNNIISNTGIGKAANFYNSAADYNIIHNTTPPLMASGSFNFNSLSHWTELSGQDVHSLQENPGFVSNTNLHTNAPLVNGRGTPLIPPVSIDFDGETRNATNPDPGADEFGFLTDDIAVAAIRLPDTLVEGDNEVTAIVTNMGTNTVSAYNIGWAYNAATQPTALISASLAAGMTDTITLGVIDMQAGSSYAITAYTFDPNGNDDSAPLNDTLDIGPVYPMLSGTYTIGGGSPDFATIVAAFQAIQLGGILDSVNLAIRQGIYHDPMVPGTTSHYDCSKPVRIYSESGNPADVVFDNANLLSPVVKLNNVKGFHFENITFSLTTSAIHNVVLVENGASCNSFTGCIFNGRISTQTTTAYAVALCSSTQGVNNDFMSCVFNYGSLSLSTTGPSSASNAQVDIINNTFKNGYRWGMLISSSNGAIVQGNVDTLTAAQHASRDGMFASACKNIVFSNNRLTNLYGNGIGIGMTECDGLTGDTSLFYNNYAYVASGTAIYVSYSNRTAVSNNTGRSLGGYGAQFTWSSDFKIENNIFTIKNSGAAIELLNMQGTNYVSTNNCLHAVNANIGEFNNAIKPTFADWQASGFDLNSISADPYFSGNTYHIHLAALDGRATPKYFVDDDLDGEIRNATMPDLGADEFTPLAHDGGLTTILNPLMPFAAGVNPVYVRFYNNGSDTLTSLQFNWSINDTLQSPFTWNGILSKATVYDSLEIGSYNFANFQAYDIKVWVSLPNGMADGYHANDTVTVENQYAGLQGIYTIGGTDPDFETITAAVAALNQSGAAGPTTFTIRSGTYAQPVLLNDFAGSYCDRPVIFQSETENADDVTITNLGINAHTVVLNGADGVEFRKLTIVSVNTAFRHAVQYSNGSHCNTFADNNLIGFQSTATANTSAVVRSLVGQDTANVFVRNIIKYGSYGFHLTGTAGLWSGVTITDNDFQQVYYRGIYGIRQNGISIAHNNMVMSGHTALLGMELYESHELNEIAYNKIVIPVGNYGILIDNCDQTATTPARIYNNFVSVGGTGIARPLYITGSAFVDVYHNNLNAYSTNATLANTAPIYVTSNPSLRIINNAARNTGPGYAIYSSSNTAMVANNNAYHTAGTTFGFWNAGAAETTFAQWQTASMLDANSININPAFISNTDLHTYLTLLNGVGQAGTGIPDDFDGDVRSATPDIGGDEFDPLPLDDAGIFMYAGPNVPFAHGNKNVELVLKNFGGNTLTSVTVRWTVNGLEQAPLFWTGSLPSTHCDTFTVGSFLFEELTQYQIDAWTESPNTNEDAVPDNDLISTDPFYASLSGIYTVGGFAPDFNLVSDLETILMNAGIIGNVTFNFRPGTYAEAIAIDDFPRINYAHSVTFQSESGDSSDVVLTQNGNGVTLIDLDDAHRIAFKEITLLNTKGHVMYIRNGASIINVENSRLEGLATLSSSRSLIISTTTTEDSITILNNVLQHGYYGIYLYGGDYEKRHLIQGNTFLGNYNYCVYLRKFDGITLSGNHFNPTWTSAQEIYMYDGTGAHTITKNKIIGDLEDVSILLSSLTNVSANTTLFTNNYVYKAGNTSADVVQIVNVSKINIDFNTIHNATPNASSATLYTENITTSNIRNNILYGVSGIAYQNSGVLPTIHNYNAIFSLGPIDAQQNSTTYATLAAYAAGTSTNANSKGVDPLFTAPGTPAVSQYMLNGTGIAVSGITTDIDGATRTSPPDMGAKEFTPLMHDIKLSHITAPQDGCGLEADEAVTVVLVNQGSSNATGFNIHFAFDGQVINENIGAQVVVAGDSLNYTFVQTIDAADFETYGLEAWHTYGADLQHNNDTAVHSFTNNAPFENPVSNLIPANGTTGLENQVSLSWSPVEGAVAYDLYLWPSSGSKPVNPTHASLTTINKLVTGLTYGTLYRWQVHAINICDDELPSDTSTFNTRILPDLVVTSITIPATAYSEQVIGVEWIVQNQGAGLTVPGTWFDNIYLSPDPTYNSFDPLLGSIANLTSLPAGQSYSHAANVTLPQGTNGLYYIIVKTDHYNGVKETSDANNTTYSVSQINVTLSPPPDLIVTSITTPALTFSGQLANITYEVRNNGDGITTDNIWKDEIWLIPAASNGNGITQLLSTRTHVGHLEPDSMYIASQQLMMPENIFGDYTIRVHTDSKNDVFEFASENNNQTISPEFEIILTPPVDLVPESIALADTLSLYQSHTLTYQVHNHGGSSPAAGWTDRYYLSQSPVYNTNFLIHLGYVYHAAGLMPDTFNAKSVSLWLSGNYSGTYYIYVHTDYNNHINEFAFEGNNILRSAPFEIIRPDLRPDSMIHTGSVMSGNTISLRTEIVNDGPGHSFGSITNRYYLSADQVLNTMTDVLLTSGSMSNVTIGTADTVSHTRSLSMPPNMFGPHYLLAHIDASGAMHEENESDNVKASPVTIFESPHPDVIASMLTSPDTATAGVPFTINYTLTNQGDQRMNIAATDSVFLSFSTTWNRSTAVPLATRTTSLLDTSQSIAHSAAIEINIAQNPNIYYIYIISDAKAALYEGSGESNNILRSNAMVVLAYPEIDLSIQSINGIPDTVTSGQTLAATYSIVNHTNFQTYYPSWTERYYFSTDSLFDAGTDMLLGGFIYEGGRISALDDKNTSGQLLIPNGITGDYYLFIETDAIDINNDPVRSNNSNTVRVAGSAHRIHVKLALYPDLQMSAFSSPVEIVSGQFFTITRTVVNAGAGNSGPRVDKLFVSTDNSIGTGDLTMASSSRPGLASGLSQTDTLSVFVPANYSGNYYLIHSIDHGNVVYEHLGENNNVLLASIIATPSPPADLIVRNVVVQDSVLAGDSTVIMWETKNQGANPAYGNFREIVYLSTDTSWQVTDEVIGVLDAGIALSPNAAVTKSVTLPVNNITNGDYHTLVRTDARNNIPESNELNNDGYSFDLTNVEIEEIFVNNTKYTNLNPAINRYFKVLIEPEFAERNLLVQLKGDSLAGINQLYVKFGAVPTPADHDYAYSEPFSDEQRIMVRNMLPGYYYILVNGYKPNDNTPQEISLLASVLSMEILDIEPREAGNKGFTTVEAIGSELDSIVLVKLVRADTTLPYHEIVADTFFMMDEGTRIIARFNLNNEALGNYHFLCHRESIWLAKDTRGFEIVEGQGADIQVAWEIQPKSYNPRFNSLLQIKVDVENTGDADAEERYIRVGTANFNNQVYYSLQDYYGGITHTQLVLPAEDQIGFPGILRPGGRRTYYVFGSIGGTQGFAIQYDK
jgi:hypothetical protein